MLEILNWFPLLLLLTVGYGPYLGKKLDLACMDGRKWHCLEKAAPDSKYIERHMPICWWWNRQRSQWKSSQQSMLYTPC
ncbi:hypothetical protein E2562_026990 [Oryza meyeriana var. granulata]|uniref:Uncharacterized protein n=1 Tax=Oryza meyeriana var. granulata TaxID=110450 RepID=A0A6G1EPU2_9ORYZ|nr:hypothetical protein E2562_026990 [Oryza meyeriana var. granulata]